MAKHPGLQHWSVSMFGIPPLPAVIFPSIFITRHLLSQLTLCRIRGRYPGNTPAFTDCECQCSKGRHLPHRPCMCCSSWQPLRGVGVCSYLGHCPLELHLAPLDVVADQQTLLHTDLISKRHKTKPAGLPLTTHHLHNHTTEAGNAEVATSARESQHRQACDTVTLAAAGSAAMAACPQQDKVHRMRRGTHPASSAAPAIYSPVGWPKGAALLASTTADPALCQLSPAQPSLSYPVLTAASSMSPNCEKWSLKSWSVRSPVPPTNIFLVSLAVPRCAFGTAALASSRRPFSSCRRFCIHHTQQRWRLEKESDCY